MSIRRKIHFLPEIGFDLQSTSNLIKEKLDQYGILYENIGDICGVVGYFGNAVKGNTLLLRADIDALPIIEKNEEEYASKNNYGYLCGHDLHTAILLIVLKMLKEDEKYLNGQIKFLFQPAEEELTGGAVMIKEGILNDSKSNAGIALHMWPNSDEIDV